MWCGYGILLTPITR